MTLACEIDPSDQKLMSAGGVAGLIFCGVAIYGIASRPGFDLQRHAVSNLSLGEGGWMMVASFIVSGLLTLLCALGLSHVLKEGRGRRALPGLIALYGLGLIVAGIFPPPACCGFPEGTPQDQVPVMTPAAIVHSIAFMVAFNSLTIACFVASVRLSGTSSLLCLLAGLAMPLLVALGMTGTMAPGIAFFAAAIVGWVWLTVVVMMLAGATVKRPDAALAAAS